MTNMWSLLYVKDKEVSFKIYRDFYVRFNGIYWKYVHELTCRFAGYPHKIYGDLYIKLVRNCLQNLPEITCS